MLLEILFDKKILISKTEIILGIITGYVLNLRAWLAIEQIGCEHKIFLFVQYRYQRTNFKVKKLLDRNPYQLGFGYIQNIPQWGPIPILPLKHYVLWEGR